jgi:hypothetical protein
MAAAPVSAGAASLAHPFDTGPFARVQERLRLGRLERPRVVRRAIILAAIAWLPLLILAAIEGLALGATPRESLLLDLSAYARYLVALPVLVFAEAACLPRLSGIARHFGESGLISDADRTRYEAAIASSAQLLDWRWVAWILVLVAYVWTVLMTQVLYPSELSSWVARITDGERALSLAGWWRLLVSQPLFLLLAVAWLWRAAVWGRFLWKVSRLDLQLVPAHPDLVGGLSFVSGSLSAFALISLAIGVTLAGSVAESIFIDRAMPSEFRAVPVFAVVVVLILFAAPLLVFGRALRSSRRRGMHAYGELAAAVGQRFERRWLGRRESVDDEALAVPDFSATTDLYALATNVRNMRSVVIDVRSLIPLVATSLLPFVLVIALAIPPKEILKLVARLVM